MIAIDKLCYRSKLRYENAGVKFAFSMLTLLFCIVNRSIGIACIVLAVNGILTVKYGGIPFSRYIRFMTIPLIFLFLSTIAIILNLARTPLDLFAIPIGSFYLTGSRASCIYALQLILTALSSVSCLYFLSMTTPMPDILNVLRKLHCPKLLIELMLLIYRFIFVLMDTAHAISTSQRSRLGNRDYKTSVKSFGMLGSVLMIRAIKRSNALYNAMEARCYDDTIHVLNETYPPSKRAVIWIIIFESFLLILTIGRYFI